MTSAARPTVTTFNLDGSDAKTNVLPTVFLAPIRADVVHFVHTNIAKNARQAYATKPFAGHDVSAHSWGTGRAVARIPRVSGGGTSRGGQGAYGNMCRGGHMFGATKIWRRWHRRVNQNQRRYAVCSALAASAVPSLVQARGHRVSDVPEFPLVISDDAQKLQKTAEAVKALTAVGAWADCKKSKDSKKIRTGTGKMRNRRYVLRRGPLVVYSSDMGISQAFRNLPGVDVANVECLNLLQLAPGGHLGRFIIWTESAFRDLNALYGSFNRESTQKKGFRVPRAKMYNSDLTRLINSSEIQEVVRPAVKATRKARLKKNPLKNLGAMIKLNPYAAAVRRAELLNQERLAKARKAKVAIKRREMLAAKAKKARASHNLKRKGDNYKMLTQDEFNGGYVEEIIDDPEWIEPEASESEEEDEGEADEAEEAPAAEESGSDSSSDSD